LRLLASVSKYCNTSFLTLIALPIRLSTEVTGYILYYVLYDRLGQASKVLF
jgi:hypothetical protein